MMHSRPHLPLLGLRQPEKVLGQARMKEEGTGGEGKRGELLSQRSLVSCGSISGTLRRSQCAESEQVSALLTPHLSHVVLHMHIVSLHSSPCETI